jgi:ribonuclease BN (tRNA processing enzyme)
MTEVDSLKINPCRGPGIAVLFAALLCGIALFAVLNAPNASAQQSQGKRKDVAKRAAAQSKPTMELVVLGSGGPRADGRGGTSYVILIQGVPRILVDAGSGAFVEIGKLDLDLDKMDVVLLTHLHIDHGADLPSVINARSLSADDPVTYHIFGPDGGGEFPSTTKFLQLIFNRGGIYQYQRGFGVEETIDGKDLPNALNTPEKEIFSEGDLHVREIATHHGDCPSVAYRVEFKGQSITFAGDMDGSALGNLEKLAKDTDLLVMHAAILDPPDTPALLLTFHTPPKQLGEAAKAANAKHVVLSHIPPVVESHQTEVMRSIRASYAGPVEMVHDGQKIAVTKEVK